MLSYARGVERRKCGETREKDEENQIDLFLFHVFTKRYSQKLLGQKKINH